MTSRCDFSMTTLSKPETDEHREHRQAGADRGEGEPPVVGRADAELDVGLAGGFRARDVRAPGQRADQGRRRRVSCFEVRAVLQLDPATAPHEPERFAEHAEREVHALEPGHAREARCLPVSRVQQRLAVDADYPEVERLRAPVLPVLRARGVRHHLAGYRPRARQTRVFAGDERTAPLEQLELPRVAAHAAVESDHHRPGAALELNAAVRDDVDQLLQLVDDAGRALAVLEEAVGAEALPELVGRGLAVAVLEAADRDDLRVARGGPTLSLETLSAAAGRARLTARALAVPGLVREQGRAADHARNGQPERGVEVDGLALRVCEGLAADGGPVPANVDLLERHLREGARRSAHAAAHPSTLMARYSPRIQATVVSISFEPLPTSAATFATSGATCVTTEPKLHLLTSPAMRASTSPVESATSSQAGLSGSPELSCAAPLTTRANSRPLRVSSERRSFFSCSSTLPPVSSSNDVERSFCAAASSSSSFASTPII